MTAPTASRFLILGSFLLALTLAIVPLPVQWQDLRPHWPALILIYWAINQPERVNVGTGWLLGLLLDVLTGTLLGQNALCLSIVAYLATRLHRRMPLFSIWQQILTVWVLLLIDRLLFLWVLGAIGYPPSSLTYWLSPVSGMLLWPVVAMTFNLLQGHWRRI